MDEPAVLLTRTGTVFVALVCAAGCELTKVGLVSVRNETAASVQVQARLEGNAGFEPPFEILPAGERTLLKYEEGRFEMKPISSLVLGLEIETETGCVARLDREAVERASARDPKARHWTIHLRENALNTADCQASGGAGSGGKSPPRNAGPPTGPGPRGPPHKNR